MVTFKNLHRAKNIVFWSNLYSQHRNELMQSFGDAIKEILLVNEKLKQISSIKYKIKWIKAKLYKHQKILLKHRDAKTKILDKIELKKSDDLYLKLKKIEQNIENKLNFLDKLRDNVFSMNSTLDSHIIYIEDRFNSINSIVYSTKDFLSDLFIDYYYLNQEPLLLEELEILISNRENKIKEINEKKEPFRRKT